MAEPNRSDKYRLTQAEMDRIIAIKADPSIATTADNDLITKYNTWTTYSNAEEKQAFERAITDAEGRGPIEYTVRDAVMESGFLPPSQVVAPALASQSGQIYDIFEGRLADDTTDLAHRFMATDEGWIPLGAEAAKLGEQYGVNRDKGLFVGFNLEGERNENIGGASFPVFVDRATERAELPPGVVQGIPDGEDPADYISVGKLDRQGGEVGRPGDPHLYVKILDRPEGDIALHPAERRVVEYPTMPDEPEYNEPLAAIDPAQEEERRYTEDEGINWGESDYDSFQGGEEPVVEEEKAEKERDPLLVPNILASVGSALGGIDFRGVSYQVPRYDQGQYASPQLGPAVQNLFRGR